ncbi:MAG: triose-phosphate isomerase family protein, partial [Methyloligellaceae bacterium]
MTKIRPLVAGNWKMNGLKESVSKVLAIKDKLSEDKFNPKTDVMICPPAPLISTFAELVADSEISVGGQDCHSEISGAHTGDVSAEMLADSGAVAIIVGHSERRTDHGEQDNDVYLKTLAAHRAGLTAIVCVGETESERRSKQ